MARNEPENGRMLDASNNPPDRKYDIYSNRDFETLHTGGDQKKDGSERTDTLMWLAHDYCIGK